MDPLSPLDPSHLWTPPPLDPSTFGPLRSDSPDLVAVTFHLPRVLQIWWLSPLTPHLWTPRPPTFGPPGPEGPPDLVAVTFGGIAVRENEADALNWTTRDVKLIRDYCSIPRSVMTVTKQRHSAAFKARVALEAAKQTRTLAEPSCAEPRGRHSTRGRPGSGAGRPAPSTFPPPRGNPAFLRARCFRCELARSSATSGRNDASWSYTTLRRPLLPFRGCRHSSGSFSCRSPIAGSLWPAKMAPFQAATDSDVT